MVGSTNLGFYTQLENPNKILDGFFNNQFSGVLKLVYIEEFFCFKFLKEDSS